MTRFILILALLAQASFRVSDNGGGPYTLLAPKPKTAVTPDTEIECLRQTGAKKLPPPLPKGKFPFVAVDNGTFQLTIADGDMPVGPCDLGKLVRAARSHMKLEHPPLPSNMLCLNKATQSWGTCLGDPEPVPLSEDFNSWEVCGDEGDGGWGTFTYPTPALPRDAKRLREMADCIDRRAEKRKRAAKWQEEQEAKRAKVEADLRAEIALCEPKKPEPGR